MRHHTQSGSGNQIPLAFNPMAGPEDMSGLRKAYERLELSRHLSFEQVMANRVYAIGVRNLADAIERRGRTGNSSRSTRRANAMSSHRSPIPRFPFVIIDSGVERGDR